MQLSLKPSELVIIFLVSFQRKLRLKEVVPAVVAVPNLSGRGERRGILTLVPARGPGGWVA